MQTTAAQTADDYSFNQRRAGTPHPLSPGFFASEGDFQAFCKRHYPFGTKTTDEATSQLTRLRERLESSRQCLASAERMGDGAMALRFRREVAECRKCIRNGEAYFRALGAASDRAAA